MLRSGQQRQWSLRRPTNLFLWHDRRVTNFHALAVSYLVRGPLCGFLPSDPGARHLVPPALRFNSHRPSDLPL